MKYKNLILGAAVCFSGSFYAQEIEQENIETLREVVIIDSKFDLPRENSGKVVAKITGEELERSKGQTLPEVINRVSGIEIGGARGNEGQNLGYYVRGGRNRQVVILVDGIQVNDPSSIANDFDLRLLPLSQVASVEIIKGAASTLYGSGAGTAVINIQTKDAPNKKIGLQWQSSVGTNQAQDDQKYAPAEFQNSLSLGGNVSKWSYQARFNHRYSDNLSAMSLDNGEEYEENIFRKYNLFGKLGYEVNESFKFNFFGNYDRFTSSFDDYDFTDGSDALQSEQLRIGSQWEYSYANGSVVFNNSYNFIDRKIEAEFPNSFDAELFVFDIYNKYHFSDQFYGLLGVNGQFSSFNSYEVPWGGTDSQQRIDQELAHFEIVDPYVNLVYISEFGLNINTGVRMNSHSTYGTNWVYNFNPSYNVYFGSASLKFLGSYSSAYITPSLYQLFDPMYGNAELQAEENSTAEGGLEFNTGSLRASAVYFNRKEKNFIDFILVDPANFGYSYLNIEKEFRAQGVELEFWSRISNELSFNANYTFTETDARFAPRLPKHKINAGVDYAPWERTAISLKYQFNGERTDSFYNESTFAVENVEFDSFGLVDLFASHRLSDRWEVFGGVYNLFNEEYRELYGFTTRGRNVRLGFSLSI